MNAAFEEFSKYGLKKASLNNILKNAKVSKGGFYHHFKDKQDLFDYLVDMISKYNLDVMENAIDWSNSDIIYRICEITKCKLKMAKDYPYITSFAETFEDVLLTDEKKEQLKVWRQKIYSFNVDDTLFKEGLTKREVLHISRWTLKGLYLDLLKSKNRILLEKEIDMLLQACDDYYETLKLSLYR